MCHKKSLFLLFIVFALERSHGVENFLKDTSKTAIQPKEEDRNLEDESLWCAPEHVHLSYGKSAFDVTLTWATKGNCKMMVQFASHPWSLDKKADAKMIELSSAVNNSLKYIHMAVLQNLSPLTTYYCRVVTLNEVGKHLFYFKTAGGSNETVNFLIASSLDNKVTVMSIMEEAMTGWYNALLYTGDLEAKLNLNFEESDDSFMLELEQFSEFLPVLTVPGKKSDQREDGLYLYRNMFSMPNTEWPTPAEKLWYSLDIGPVHLISYSSGVLIDADSRMSKLQQDWLVNDLTLTNKRRDTTPWVIALGSHPMYCAHGVKDVQDCALNTSRIRQGLEDIFFHFGVDLIIASRHSYYERVLPQYKGVVVGTSYQQPRAPVEVILGSCEGRRDAREETVNSTAKPVDWSAFHLKDEAVNSFASLSVVNASHLEWKLMSADGQTVLDSFWLVQDYHANFRLQRGAARAPEEAMAVERAPNQLKQLLGRRKKRQASRPTIIGFSPKEKADLIKLHNNYRRHEGATDMLEMMWDSHLETSAQKHTEKCNFDHTIEEGRKNVGSYDMIGENLFVSTRVSTGYVDVRFIVNDWFEEKVNYSFNARKCTGDCGHYTQVVWSETFALGCGRTSCKAVMENSNLLMINGDLITCHYGPAGNWKNEKVYTRGTPCTGCPEGRICMDNLCALSASALNCKGSEKTSSSGLTVYILIVLLFLSIIFFFFSCELYLQLNKFVLKFSSNTPENAGPLYLRLRKVHWLFKGQEQLNTDDKTNVKHQ